MSCTHFWVPVPETRGTYRCLNCAAFGYRPEGGGHVRAHTDQKTIARRVTPPDAERPRRSFNPEELEELGLGAAPIEGDAPDPEDFVYPEEEK